MKKYIPLDFDEKGKVILGNAKNAPTPNGTIPAIFIPGGSDENKQGLKSITISPAITTTPALDSLFPIYWDDLPEGEIDEGMEYRSFETTLHTGHALEDGAEYSVAYTPSPEWHIDMISGGGDAGETVTTTKASHQGNLNLFIDVKDANGEKCINVSIIITE